MNNIDKYAKGFKEKIKPRYNAETNSNTVEPFRDAQFALTRASFTNKERNEFLDAAFTDILTDLFTAWITSPTHHTKEREFIYHSGLALGDLKARLIAYETYGKNASHVIDSKQQEDTNDEQT